MRRMSRMPTEATIYVIDDDDAVRQSLEFLLKAAGIPVRGFESAQAVLDVLSTVEHGCIVTDVRMPEITGIDLLKKVKQTRPELPVIVITGHGDVSLAVEAMKIGAVGVGPPSFSAAANSRSKSSSPVAQALFTRPQPRATATMSATEALAVG